VVVPAGTASAGGVQVGTNAGIFSPGANQVAISTNGTGRLFVDASGNIGIGAAPSAYKSSYTGFDIRTGSLWSAAGIGLVGLASNVYYNNSNQFIYKETDAATLYQGYSGVHTFYTAGSGTAGTVATLTERMRLDSSGRLGLGISAPSTTLHIVGSGVINVATGTGPILYQAQNSDFSALGYFGTEGNTAGATLTGTLANATLIASGATGTALQLGTGGVIRATLTSTGLGIGTTSLQKELQINATTPTIRLEENGGGSKRLEISIDSSALARIDATQSGSQLLFGTVGTERARIDSSGRLLVGKSATEVGLGGSDLLQVAGAINVVSSTNIYSRLLPTSSGLEIIANAYPANLGTTQSIIFKSGTSGGGGPSEIARFTSDGRLLVGTSSARTIATQSWGIQQEGTTYNNTGMSLTANRNDADGTYLVLGKTRGTSVGSNTIVQAGDTLGGIFFAGADGSTVDSYGASIKAAVDGTPGANDMPGRLVFSTTADGAASPTERMKINNVGNVSIKSAVSVSAGSHDIQDNGSSPNTLRLYNTTDSNNSTNRFLICDAAASVLRAEIRSNGGLANYSANNANLSDRNVKKDISPAADTWNCLKEWEIVNYRYKDQPDDADLNLGVIAQQVAESCPEVITIFQEAKEAIDDAPAREERLGVKEQQMYWMAIKALQEAQVRIEQLESKVAALESA
jgi:hypothetical protein